MTKENGNRQREGQGTALTQEELARRERERKIQDLLPDQDEALGKAYDSRLLRRLLRYNLPYLQKLIAAMALMAISSLLSVSIPWIIGRAIDDGIRTGSLMTVRFWALLFLLTAAGEWLFNRYRIGIMAYVGTRVVADMRSDLFRHLLCRSKLLFVRQLSGRQPGAKLPLKNRP